MSSDNVPTLMSGFESSVLQMIYQMQYTYTVVGISQAKTMYGCRHGGVNGCSLQKLCVAQVTERGILITGESGIFTPEHVAFVQSTGCGAILVGESLVKTGDPAAAVKALLS